DVGIVLGQALRLALGDKKGIVRYGTSFVPMDEALASASVDLSGRPFLVFGVPVARTRVSNFDLDLLQEFFRAFAVNAELTLHVIMHYGHNPHHVTEPVVEAVGRAGIPAVVTQDPRAVDEADAVVLPGDGAFHDAMANLEHLGLLTGLGRALDGSRPFVGICLGYQLLFSTSEEFGEGRGLDVIPGVVRR